MKKKRTQKSTRTPPQSGVRRLSTSKKSTSNSRRKGSAKVAARNTRKRPRGGGGVVGKGRTNRARNTKGARRAKPGRIRKSHAGRKRTSSRARKPTARKRVQGSVKSRVEKRLEQRLARALKRVRKLEDDKRLARNEKRQRERIIKELTETPTQRRRRALPLTQQPAFQPIDTAPLVIPPGAKRIKGFPGAFSLPDYTGDTYDDIDWADSGFWDDAYDFVADEDTDQYTEDAG